MKAERTAEYDWLIIGGGPHGRFIASAISRAVPSARLAIVDPEPPLAAWQRRAAACGMRYLRSSSAHHLGPSADSLRRFAAAQAFGCTHSLGRYRRPSLALFNAHAAAVLDAPEHIRATARRLHPHNNGWTVECNQGPLRRAARVVLATGPLRAYRPVGLGAAEHVFDPDFTLGPPGPDTLQATLIVGGGISGAQLALNAARAGHRVCWLTRGRPRPAEFDADPCYAGPRCLAPFAAASIAARTRLLAEARRPGTLPLDVYAAITAALANGELAWRRGAAQRTTARGLILADGRTLAADRVILATGFAAGSVSDSPLGRTINTFGLAEDRAGHLWLDPELQAAPGLHVTGRPASLQLGPMAGNIKGARLAGQILAEVARRGAQSPRPVAPAAV